VREGQGKTLKGGIGEEKVWRMYVHGGGGTCAGKGVVRTRGGIAAHLPGGEDLTVLTKKRGDVLAGGKRPSGVYTSFN